MPSKTFFDNNTKTDYVQEQVLVDYDVVDPRVKFVNVLIINHELMPINKRHYVGDHGVIRYADAARDMFQIEFENNSIVQFNKRDFIELLVTTSSVNGRRPLITNKIPRKEDINGYI